MSDQEPSGLTLDERIRDMEQRLTDAKARLPKHSPPMAIYMQIDELELELERLRALRDQGGEL